MQSIHYSPAKLWVGAITSAHFALFLGYFFFNPQSIRAPYAFLFNGSLAHFFTLPLGAVFCAAATIRCVVVALGSCTALATDDDGVTINTIWRSHRIVWSDLLGIRVELRRVRRTDVYSLKFDKAHGGTISLPLNGLDLPQQQDAFERLAKSLSETHLAAINRRAPLVMKAASSTAVDATSLVRARPAFGRKIA